MMIWHRFRSLTLQRILKSLAGTGGEEVNIMKKLFSLLFVLFACVVSYGQDSLDVTHFLGIPVDGTKEEVMSKLKAKGFVNMPDDDEILVGEFNGKNVFVNVRANNQKVFLISVLDVNACDESQIKTSFNNLCRQFKNDSKYISFSDHTIPESEKIGHEMLVNKKIYTAYFFQKPKVVSGGYEDLSNRVVWFTINVESNDSSQYRILMYYVNGYNEPKDGD